MVFSGYEITSSYGWRLHPIDKTNKFHAGVDLVWYHKAPIRPFVSGKVLYAGEGKPGTGVGGYGNVVFIEDKHGVGHLYAHLDSVTTKKGNNVTTGDVIGKQGKTGKVTGSHLHYEVRKKTTPSLGWTTTQEKSTYNPSKYLKTYVGGGNMGSLKVDGYLGPKTVKRLQQFLGTTQDGEISKPSLMVKELQRFLNKYGR